MDYKSNAIISELKGKMFANHFVTNHEEITLLMFLPMTANLLRIRKQLFRPHLYKQIFYDGKIQDNNIQLNPINRKNVA